MTCFKSSQNAANGRGYIPPVSRDIVPRDSFAALVYTFHQVLSFLEYLADLIGAKGIWKHEISVLVIGFALSLRQDCGWWNHAPQANDS